MTRYELVSGGAREANNELKTGLFGSDKSVSTTPRAQVTVFCLGVMSTSEVSDLSPEKMFPSLQKCPESEK